MTFTQTVIKQTFHGDKRVVWGTWATDADNGVIKTGLHSVQHFDLQYLGATAPGEAASVNEVFPCGGDVRIVVTSGKGGAWIAVGL